MSFPYFHRHHFRAAFDSDFSEPEHPPGAFHFLSIGRLQRFPESPFTEAVRAAGYIGETLSQPVLCLSGGLDSEAMALAFLEAGIPFTAATMNLDSGSNNYDIEIARNFCEQHKIPLQEVHIPALEILQSGRQFEIAETYRTLSPERALFILFLSQIKGDPVLAGEILRKESLNGMVNFFCPKDRDLCYWRYFKQTRRKGIPYFHYYTPELTYSFLAHTRMGKKEFSAVDWTGRPQEFYQHKRQTYLEGGFPVEDPPLRRQKWHGYEGIKIKFDQLHGSTQAYNAAFRVPLEENPSYDVNQLFLVADDDELAHRILAETEV